MDTDFSPPEHPFEHVALSLSGGGVRAVGYHLGTLDYLERVAILPQVHTLSSVSGGSLVAIGYTLSLKSGETFQEFYDNICEFLPELNTLEDLLLVLEQRDPPVASGSRTLITALAKVYSDKYFNRYYNDPPFGVLWDKEPEIHLKEIIFNATEFKTGFAFRFQKGQFNSMIGSPNVWIQDEHAKEIRMSDIMASSSCIPGGMEPLMFPQDFHWPGDVYRRGGKSERPFCDKVENDLWERFKVRSIPLMDGGVYDNQGVASIILTQARRFRGTQSIDKDEMYEELSELEPVRPRDWARWLLASMERASDVANQKDMGDVDLFIVSDTPLYRDPMYDAKPVSQASQRGFIGWLRQLTLGTVNTIVSIVTLMLFFSFVVFLIVDPPENSLVKAFYILETALLLLLVASSVGLWLLIRRKGIQMAEALVEVMPPMKRGLWSYASGFRLGQIWDMTTLRATSMSALTSRIFMNRIRQLGYSLLYSHENYERRVMDNNINDIGSLSAGKNKDLPDFVFGPSTGLQAVVDRAAAMKTKLWIDQPEKERHDLDVLVAAGHISTCFNVIEYLWQSWRDENGQLDAKVVPLFEQAKRDWQKLNEDPYWLVDKRNNAGRESGKVFWSNASARHKKRWARRAKAIQPA